MVSVYQNVYLVEEIQYFAAAIYEWLQRDMNYLTSF